MQPQIIYEFLISISLQMDFTLPVSNLFPTLLHAELQFLRSSCMFTHRFISSFWFLLRSKLSKWICHNLFSRSKLKDMTVVSNFSLLQTNNVRWMYWIPWCWWVTLLWSGILSHWYAHVKSVYSQNALQSDCTSLHSHQQGLEYIFLMSFITDAIDSLQSTPSCLVWNGVSLPFWFAFLLPG